LRPDTRDLHSLGVQGEASRIRDEYSIPRSTGVLFRQRTGQVRRLQGGPGVACQRNGQDIINVVEAHHLSGGRTDGVSPPPAAQSPYVTLRALAYVTNNQP
jgi:hypothetical protein